MVEGKGFSGKLNANFFFDHIFFLAVYTTAYADIGNLKSLNTLFDKHPHTVLVKSEHNCRTKLHKLWSFLKKKMVNFLLTQARRPFYSPSFCGGVINQIIIFLFEVIKICSIIQLHITNLECLSQLNYSAHFGDFKQKTGDLKFAIWSVISPQNCRVEWTFFSLFFQYYKN